jgi:hypothetical protein
MSVLLCEFLLSWAWVQKLIRAQLLELVCLWAPTLVSFPVLKFVLISADVPGLAALQLLVQLHMVGGAIFEIATK